MVKIDIENKQFTRLLLTMLESGLIHYRHYSLWTDEIILDKGESCPDWITDLSAIKNLHEAKEVISTFTYREPFEDFDHTDVGNNYIASYLLSYMNNQISWATFLLQAGEYSDGLDCNHDCEFFYEFYNRFVESEFSKKTERQQFKKIFKEFENNYKKVKDVYDFFIFYFRKFLKK